MFQLNIERNGNCKVLNFFLILNGNLMDFQIFLFLRKNRFENFSLNFSESKFKIMFRFPGELKCGHFNLFFPNHNFKIFLPSFAIGSTEFCFLCKWKCEFFFPIVVKWKIEKFHYFRPIKICNPSYSLIFLKY